MFETEQTQPFTTSDGRLATIRLANSHDVFRIRELHDLWIGVGRDNHSDKSKGYLFGVPYDLDDLLTIIEKGAISVVDVDGVVAGYFLFDDWTQNPTTQSYRLAMKDLRFKTRLRSGGVCARAQIAIAPECQSLGLYRPLQDFLFAQWRGKFDAVFSVVSKLNSKSAIHRKYGWDYLWEDEDCYYVLRSLAAIAIRS